MRLLVALVVTFLCSLVGAAKVNKSTGCGKAVQTDPLQFQGRDYVLHLPANYDNSRAHGLIFSYHGRGENATRQQNISQLSDPAFNPYMIVVYPEDTTGFGKDADAKKKKTWQGDPDDKNNTLNDVDFTLQLAKDLSDRYCVDLNQWYASGKSMGGEFAVNILACDHEASQKFAAFAGIASADYTKQPGKGCNPETVQIACNAGRKGVPIFENHGTADTTIDIRGSGEHKDKCLPSILHFMEEWAVRDGFKRNSGL